MTPELGPVTEARFAEAFAERALIGRKDAAQLLGVGLDAFDTLGLPSVPKGRGERARGYTEHALRAFLAAQLAAAPAPARPRPPRPHTGKVMRFTDRHRV
jgi:hypothetical protein